MRTLKRGDVTVQRVVDVERLVVAADEFLTGASREGVRAEQSWLGPDFIDPDTQQLIWSVQSFLVRTPRQTILVDTCCGNGRDRGEGNRFHQLNTPYLDNLAAAGVRPEEVDIVFCTHLHGDHVGWNVQQVDGRWVPTFPNARYLMGRTEYEFWREAVPRGIGSYGTRAAFDDSVMPIVAAGLAVLVDTDRGSVHELDGSMVLENLPGHTPGQAGLHIRSPQGDILISGDAIHHPVQVANPAWHSWADVDSDASTATRRGMIERYGDTDTVILTAHFRAPTAGRIVSHGNGARFAFQS